MAQIFETLNIVAAIFTWLLPETKGLSLEEMDVLFRAVGEEERRQNINSNGPATKEW